MYTKEAPGGLVLYSIYLLKTTMLNVFFVHSIYSFNYSVNTLFKGSFIRIVSRVTILVYCKDFLQIGMKHLEKQNTDTTSSLTGNIENISIQCMNSIDIGNVVVVMV